MSNLGETVGPVTTYASENFQRVVTDDDQQNDSSINRSIFVTSSSVQVKKGKSKILLSGIFRIETLTGDFYFPYDVKRSKIPY